VATRVGGLVEQFRGQTLAIMCAPDGTELRRAVETLLDDPPVLPEEAADPRQAWRREAASLLEGIGARVLARSAPEAVPVPSDAEPLDAAAVP
jgi:hypothetical protein